MAPEKKIKKINVVSFRSVETMKRWINRCFEQKIHGKEKWWLSQTQNNEFSNIKSGNNQINIYALK